MQPFSNQRRTLLKTIGATSLGLVSGNLLAKPTQTSSDMPACLITPEQTEGPYFVDERLNRSDIRLDPSDGKLTAGIPLKLDLSVSGVTQGQCQALEKAVIDIWHCNSQGIYSDVRDPSFSTVGKQFLRGYQVTDNNGKASFLTIYPGWYPGRAVHIHFKVRTQLANGKVKTFTSQLYFDDHITDQVFQAPIYAKHGERHPRNDRDGIFGWHDSGQQLLLKPSLQKDGSYQASYSIGVLV